MKKEKKIEHISVSLLDGLKVQGLSTERVYDIEQPSDIYHAMPLDNSRTAQIIFKDGDFKRCDYKNLNQRYTLVDWEFIKHIAITIMKLVEIEKEQKKKFDLVYDANIFKVKGRV